MKNFWRTDCSNILNFFVSQSFSFDVLFYYINVRYECITTGMINKLLFKEVLCKWVLTEILYYYNRKKPWCLVVSVHSIFIVIEHCCVLFLNILTHKHVKYHIDIGIGRNVKQSNKVYDFLYILTYIFFIFLMFSCIVCIKFFELINHMNVT